MLNEQQCCNFTLGSGAEVGCTAARKELPGSLDEGWAVWEGRLGFGLTDVFAVSENIQAGPLLPDEMWVHRSGELRAADTACGLQ